MTDHSTPGPWTADDGDGNYFGVFGPDGQAICYLAEPAPHPYRCMVPLPAGESPGDDMKMDDARFAAHRANAHMLAAAPEMLRALKAVEEWWLREGMAKFNGAPYAMFATRAVIAKADEGASHV